MSKGFAVISGSNKVVHKFLENGTATISGSLQVTGSTTLQSLSAEQVSVNTLSATGSVTPEGDGSWDLGSSTNRWNDIYVVQTTVGAVFETGLTTPGIEELATGTVLSWVNGKLEPCNKKCDKMVMGVAKTGKQQPIVMGAEPVLVTGKVEEGDFIVTSDKEGHGEAYKFKRGSNNIFGKVIAQALESCEGDSNLIKCMINKM